MSKNDCSKPEFLTVGEMAKRMNVSVRTLQYYDREGLLPPSATSEGGRRLYTYRDMVTLHQILSMKELGFSLAEIHEKLLPLDDPHDVAVVLDQQAAAVRAQIESLQETLSSLEKLRTEVLDMNEVDFRCYADIVVNLGMHNDLYWAWKYFDAETRDRIRKQFDAESGAGFMREMQTIQDEAGVLHAEGIPPESPQAQQLAERFWAHILKFTGGDPGMLSELLAMSRDASFQDSWHQQESVSYLEAALAAYLERQDVSLPGVIEHE